MKKFLASILAVSMMLCGCAALANAESVTLQPQHEVSVDGYDGSGDHTWNANFDPETAFDGQGSMTFTVYEADLYPAADLKALKADDKVVILGEEVTVASVEETEDGVTVTAADGMTYDFRYTDDEKKDTMTVSDTDFPFATNMGTFTFKMADSVTVSAYYLDENGNPSQEMKAESVAAADVQAFFVNRSDPSAADYLNCKDGHMVTVRVTDGTVTEISADWSSED